MPDYNALGVISRARKLDPIPADVVAALARYDRACAAIAEARPAPDRDATLRALWHAKGRQEAVEAAREHGARVTAHSVSSGSFAELLEHLSRWAAGEIAAAAHADQQGLLDAIAGPAWPGLVDRFHQAAQVLGDRFHDTPGSSAAQIEAWADVRLAAQQLQTIRGHLTAWCPPGISSRLWLLPVTDLKVLDRVPIANLPKGSRKLPLAEQLLADYWNGARLRHQLSIEAAEAEMAAEAAAFAATSAKIGSTFGGVVLDERGMVAGVGAGRQ